MLLTKDIMPPVKLNHLGTTAVGKPAAKWIIPVAAAVLINIVLFGLMPGLIRSVPNKPDLAALESIQVIRIKRPDTSVVKKENRKPPKPEKKEVKPLRDLAKLTPMQKKIHLPFELNTKLPSGPQTLSMPALSLLALDSSAFGDAFGVDEIDGPLTSLAKIPPIYPMRAKRLAIEGEVTVKFLVNESGLVDHIEIINATPPDVFEKSVFNCVSKWRFKPGTVEGIPVKTWAETTIRFELES